MQILKKTIHKYQIGDFVLVDNPDEQGMPIVGYIISIIASGVYNEFIPDLVNSPDKNLLYMIKIGILPKTPLTTNVTLCFEDEIISHISAEKIIKLYDLQPPL